MHAFCAYIPRIKSACVCSVRGDATRHLCVPDDDEVRLCERHDGKLTQVAETARSHRPIGRNSRPMAMEWEWECGAH